MERSLSTWGRCAPSGALLFLIALIVTSMASAGVAPTVPTYQLKWPTAAGPLYVAIDSQGNSYVICYDANRVRKYDTLGNLLLEWGTAGSGNGQFNGPWAIAVDASDIVYVTDAGNNRIQKFTTAGAYVAQWGSGLPGPGQLIGPRGIAIDAAGNVYVTASPNRVQKFTSAGGFLFAFGSGGSGPGQFSAPEGIHVAANGTIYVADAGNNRVQYFDAGGNYLGQWGTTGSGNGQFRLPMSITADAFGSLYVSEQTGNRVQKFTSTGTYLSSWGSSGSGDGQFSRPVGVALDAAGNVYVAENGNNRVQKFNAAGEPFALSALPVINRWGPYFGQPFPMNNPTGLATDPSDNLYVADFGGHRVLKFSSTGAYLYSMGGGFASNSNGLFNGPHSVACDGSGNVYVADAFNNRIQKFNSGGTYLGQWGSAGTGNGQFSFPAGIAVDAAGNVYVSDFHNHRIQKFNSAGGFITAWGSLATLFQPSDLAIDAAGNLYVQASGELTLFTNTGTEIRQFLITASGLTVDRNGFLWVGNGPSNTISKYTNMGVRLLTVGPGVNSGPGISYSRALHADAGGNLYLSDAYQVRKFVDPPLITSITDVANDQGWSVRVRVRRTSGEAASTGVQVYAYALYRRVEPLPAGAIAAAGEAPASAKSGASPHGIAIAGWDYVGQTVATGAATYDITVPTLANAKPSSVYYSNFLVQALTTNPLVHFDSGSESGLSLDNIAPPTVTPFTGSYASNNTSLHWGLSAAPDYAGFRLYRGASEDFVPGPGNLIVATTDTGFVDPGPAGRYYKLSAVDFAENESVPSLVGPAQTVDVSDSEPPLGFALEGARPSPTQASRLNIRFTLPVAAPAWLEMFDTAGRRVASRDVGSLGAGVHSVNLSESAGARIQAGLYFLRLTQGAEVRRARVTILE